MRIVGVKGMLMFIGRQCCIQRLVVLQNILVNSCLCSSHQPALEDHIAFVFTRISERDWEREFSFTIDVSQTDYAGENLFRKALSMLETDVTLLDLFLLTLCPLCFWFHVLKQYTIVHRAYQS